MNVITAMCSQSHYFLILISIMKLVLTIPSCFILEIIEEVDRVLWFNLDLSEFEFPTHIKLHEISDV